MIRCAFAESFRLATETPARFSPSISLSSTRGSTTTPLPITQVFSEWRIPDGIRWKANVSPSRTIVWPALLPPWKRTIVVARSASRSVILPLPSSPHWAPTMTTPGTVWILTGAGGGCGALGREPVVFAVHRDHAAIAHLDQTRDRAPADLLDQLGFVEVGGHEDRSFGLVALVDERVELLQHPVGPFLGAEVVDVEEVHRGQLPEQLHVGVAVRPGVVALADPRQEFGKRVDGHRVLLLQCRFRDEHAERGLAGAGISEEPDPAAGREVLVELVEVGADRVDRGAGLEFTGHVRDRRAIEGDPSKPSRDHRRHPAAGALAQAVGSAVAGAGHVFRAEEPAVSLADPQRADLPP